MLRCSGCSSGRVRLAVIEPDGSPPAGAAAGAAIIDPDAATLDALKENLMNDTETDRVVSLDDLQRIVVQPVQLAGDPGAWGDGMDALINAHRPQVETILR